MQCGLPLCAKKTCGECTNLCALMTRVLLNNEEAISPFGDGCGLEWLNPDKPIRDILDKLAELTQSVGWTLDTSAFEPSQ